MNKRRKFTASFKTKVVLEALSERLPLHELAKKYEVHPNQISQWKSQFLDNAESVFETGSSTKSVEEEFRAKEDRLLKIIGEQKVDIDFLKKALS